jgi:hypothetical protein
MNPLDAYRDDGPLARALGRTAGARLRAGETPMTLLGFLPVAVLLAWPAHRLSVGVAIAVLAGAAALLALGAHDTGSGRIAWLLPALLRVTEYGGLLKLTVVAAPDAVPACYALLAVLAFRHYDAVYRLRHQRVGPPWWVGAVSGGWDGRLLVACVLAAAGVLEPGLWIAAAGLGTLLVGESVLSWTRFSQAERRAEYEDDDELGVA